MSHINLILEQHVRFFWGSDKDEEQKCPRCGSDVIKRDEDYYTCHWCDHRWKPD